MTNEPPSTAGLADLTAEDAWYRRTMRAYQPPVERPPTGEQLGAAVAAALDVYDAALDVLREWGDRDGVDPDRMDGRAERLRVALERTGVLGP